MTDLPPDITTRLQHYRNQIDAIDDQLITLLKQRIGIVAQVGKMKREETPLRNFIRSGREAVMVKRLYNEFRDSDFHPAAAAQMWRLIISASIHHEAPLNIATTEDFSAISAEYFGSFMPQTLTPNPLQLAAQDKQTIAVIAASEMGHPVGGECRSTGYPRQILRTSLRSSQDDALSLLAQPEFQHLKIFAILPYIPSPLPRPTAYAVAQLTPEETGEDVSLFYLSHRERSASACEQGEGAHPHPKAATHLLTSPNGRGDIIVKDCYRTELEGAVWLGSYAKAIG